MTEVGNDTFTEEDDLNTVLTEAGFGILPDVWTNTNKKITEEDAEAIMQNVRAIQAEMKFRKAQYEESMKSLKNAETRVCSTYGFYLETLARQLIRDQDGTAKSVKRNYGTMGFRASREKVEIKDEQLFIDMVTNDDTLALTDILTYKTSISKSELLKYIKENGEDLKHCELVEAGREQSFYWK